MTGWAARCFDGVRRLAGRPQRYVLVLSHMRSGSSLVHHLLQTNPSILGAGESNRVYRVPADLQRHALWVHAQRNALLGWRACVADQVNHNEKLSDVALLLRAEVQTVFLLREPRDTIASIIRLTRDFYGSAWSVDRAADYYLGRIEALRALATALRDACGPMPFVLTYDELVRDPPAALAALQSHLGLREPFSTTYRTFDFTGRRGDPSGRIKSERVLPPVRHAGDVLGADQMERLERCYRQVLASLRASAHGMGDPRLPPTSASPASRVPG